MVFLTYPQMRNLDIIISTYLYNEPIVVYMKVFKAEKNIK